MTPANEAVAKGGKKFIVNGRECNNPQGFSIDVQNGSTVTTVYDPHPHQLAYHESHAPNLLALGTRGTGKSLLLRNEAHIRCLMIPNFRALILRRTMPELRRSHLNFIDAEMKMFGGVFLHTTFTAKYPNGSSLVFAHCETEADVMNFLSSEYGFIGFDELSTFTLEQFLKISAAARAPVDAAFRAVVRAGSNPLGVGADWMYSWFVDKDVDLVDFPDYHPDDFEMQFSTLEDNPSLDANEYKARLKNLPEFVRRAWLLGERVDENTYFMDFQRQTDDGKPWHCIDHIPTYDGKPLYMVDWLTYYRAIDWGYSPDPAVCLWFVVLPNKRAVCFKERSWKETLADQVAQDVKRDSVGMKIADTFCDPTMLIKDGQSYSIGEIFERNGVPVTAMENDRILFGYSIHEFLNTVVDGLPKLQMLKWDGSNGCKDLIKTIPLMRRDPLHPSKLANGNDHWVVALAYFCMGQAPPSRSPTVSALPPWMRPKRAPRNLATL